MRLTRAAAVVTGALFLTWPAILNRYPFLYPDSMTYLADGRPVARALFLREFTDDYGMRSFFYSLGILPFHWNESIWPIVALQAFLSAYVIWLVVRSSLPERTVFWFLGVILLLGSLTSLSWYVSLIMPDVLGPLLYLSIYLLVFARDTLSPREHLGVAAIAWWAVASHATHLILASGLCIFLGVLWLIFRRGLMRSAWKGVAEVALVVLLAAASQLALHSYLYGEPSLNGDRPPFLVVRLLDDGPGRWYLEQNCAHLKFAICGRVRDLHESPDQFMWGADGVWQTSSREERKQMLKEEVPVALAILRAYPREQLSRSAENFWHQLNVFDINFDANVWILQDFNRALPGRKSLYLQSRQFRKEIPFEFVTTVLKWTVAIALGMIAVFTVILWRRRPPRLVALAVVIVPAVIANALVTGTLSMVEDRYQSRVIWLIPLLAALMMMDWLAHRASPPSADQVPAR